MQVGVRYTAREYCGFTQKMGSVTASVPRLPRWRSVVACFLNICERRCTTALLMELALGLAEGSPCDEEEIRALKCEIIRCLTGSGLELKREEDDREDVPNDFRFLDLLLRAADAFPVRYTLRLQPLTFKVALSGSATNCSVVRGL